MASGSCVGTMVGVGMGWVGIAAGLLAISIGVGVELGIDVMAVIVRAIDAGASTSMVGIIVTPRIAVAASASDATLVDAITSLKACQLSTSNASSIGRKIHVRHAIGKRR